jgi:hypothetical protein
MHDHIAIVHNDPAFARFSLYLSFFAMYLMHGVDGGVGEGVEHAVAGTGTQYEVVGEGCDVLDVEQENVLAFFIFERVDNGMCQFKCVQKSPRKLTI